MEYFKELDEIFDKEIVIKVAPELPKNSRLKTGTNYKTIVFLSIATDQRDLYEIYDIQDKDQRNCIVIQGLNEALEVGSWIKRSELPDLIRLNKNIKFIGGVRTLDK